MDFFQFLMDEHDKVKDLLERLSQSGSGAKKSRQTTLDRLEQALIPHMQAEEKLFYPQLIEQGEEDLGYEALEEHRAARSVFEDLKQLDLGDPRWHARCEVLRELLTHHIEEEESEVFDAAREFMDEKQQQDLLKQFRQQEKQIKQQIA